MTYKLLWIPNKATLKNLKPNLHISHKAKNLLRYGGTNSFIGKYYKNTNEYDPLYLNIEIIVSGL